MANSTSTSFHFARLYRGDQLDKALARHEHYLFARLGLKSGMRVLNIGCGMGRVAFELANLYNVQVIGIDTNVAKIQEAINISQTMFLNDRVTFIHVASMSNMASYAALGTFNAIYAIESLVTQPDFEGIYRQCYQLLKPYGTFGVYEWCWTTQFNPSDAAHCQLASIIEESTGISHRRPTERLLSSAVKALERSHFEIVEWADLSEVKGKPLAVPWYNVLENAVQSSNSNWPLHHASGDLSKEAAKMLVQGGVYNLFTPMAMIISRRVDIKYT